MEIKIFCLIFVQFLLINFILSHPLCGSIDGLHSVNQSDRIYFPHETIEINGTKCHPSVPSVNDSISLNEFSIPTNSAITDEEIVSFQPDTNCDKDHHALYCQNATNYPENFINALLSKSPLKNFLIIDKINVDINTRNSHGNEVKVDLCESIETVIYPKWGTRPDGTQWFIANTNEFKQGIRVSKCRNKPGSECLLSAFFPNQYRSECEQQYISRELVALKPDGTNVITDEFQFEACCSCVLYRKN